MHKIWASATNNNYQQFRERLLPTKKLIMHQLPAADGMVASRCWKRSAQRARFQLRYQLRATNNACELSKSRHSRDQQPHTHRQAPSRLGCISPGSLAQRVGKLPTSIGCCVDSRSIAPQIQQAPMAPWLHPRIADKTESPRADCRKQTEKSHRTAFAGLSVWMILKCSNQLIATACTEVLSIQASVRSARSCRHALTTCLATSQLPK